MKEFFKNLVDRVWSIVRPILPNKIKALVIKFLSKNQKILMILGPAMMVVKAIGMVVGGPTGLNVVALVSAIQRMLLEWGLTVDQLPITVATIVNSDANTLAEEQVKVALRDLAKIVLSNKKETAPVFNSLSGSEQNLLVEMAYNMSKPEIESVKISISPDTEAMNENLEGLLNG